MAEWNSYFDVSSTDPDYWSVSDQWAGIDRQFSCRRNAEFHFNLRFDLQTPRSESALVSASFLG